MATLVRHLMAQKLVTLFAEQSLPLAEDIMRYRHIRHLPVIEEDGTLVGLISHRDILKANVSSLVGVTAQQRQARYDVVKVREIMTTNVWTVTPDTLAEKAAQLLLEHSFGCLPVVENGKLVGLVTERDFLKLAIAFLEKQHDLPLPARAQTESDTD